MSYNESFVFFGHHKTLNPNRCGSPGSQKSKYKSAWDGTERNSGPASGWPSDRRIAGLGFRGFGLAMLEFLKVERSDRHIPDPRNYFGFSLICLLF